MWPATLAVPLLSACMNLSDPIPSAEDRLLVHAVLDLGARRQPVFVQRVGGTLNYNQASVVDATITITGPDGLVMTAQPHILDGEEIRAGYYFVDLDAHEADLQPGGTYTLRVVVPDGRIVTGTTAVPIADPVVQADSTVVLRFNAATDTLELAWPRSPGARSYLVTVRGRFADPYTIFADTSVLLHGNTRSGWGRAFPAGDTVTVLVAAVEDNFFRYYRMNFDPFAGAPPSRLEGGIGLFGALVPLFRQRYAVINDSP